MVNVEEENTQICAIGKWVVGGGGGGGGGRESGKKKEEDTQQATRSDEGCKNLLQSNTVGCAQPLDTNKWGQHAKCIEQCKQN